MSWVKLPREKEGLLFITATSIGLYILFNRLIPSKTTATAGGNDAQTEPQERSVVGDDDLETIRQPPAAVPSPHEKQRRAVHGPRAKTATHSVVGPYRERAYKLFEALERVADDRLTEATLCHYGVKCDYCFGAMDSIRGVRYICTECPYSEMCEQCHDAHHRSHVCYKIPRFYPRQLFNRAVPRDMLSWRADRNIELVDMGKNLSAARELDMTVVEHVTARVLADVGNAHDRQRAAMSESYLSSEINALHDQFVCFVDEVAGIDEYDHRYSDDADNDEIQEGVVSHEGFLSVLPISVYAPPGASVLSETLLKLYDPHGRGYITFSDYAVTVYLILGNNHRRQLQLLMSHCPRDVSLRLYIRGLLTAFYQLKEYAFRDAVNIQTFEPDFTSDLGDPPAEDASEKRHNDYVWEKRPNETSTWHTFDPTNVSNSETEAAIRVQHEMRTTKLLDEIFLNGSHPDTVIETILADSRLTTAVCTVLDAGIP